MNGYRKMLSDNLPRTWDLALRWCKRKNMWIEYVYKVYIKPYNNNCMYSKSENKRRKTLAVKCIIGRKAKFRNSIKWNSFLINATEKKVKQYDDWKKVVSWVEWFQKSHQYVENSAEIRVNIMKDSDEDAAKFINVHCNLNNMKLALFIVKNLK